VIVANAIGSITSAPVNLAILVAPIIVSQPQAQIITAGNTATFSVAATGIPAPSFQWFMNGTNALPGQTNATLVITNTQPSEAGQYSVLASNSVGSVASAPASLSVLDPPVITFQPADITCFLGETVVLTVTAEGRNPLSYQWFAGCSVPVSGATTASLRLKNVTPLDSGTYCVTISNVFGEVASRTATVRVLVKPVLISLTPTPGAVTVQFQTISNLLYSVDYSDKLFQPQWTPLPNASSLIGTGAPITVHDNTSPSAVRRFYRITVR